MQAIHLTPVAVVHTTTQDAPDDQQWNQEISEIHVDEALQDGLQGLDSWSHIIVIFSMHDADYNPQAHLVAHPRGRDDLPLTGVFAHRSRQRPNKIGVTAVRVLKIEGNVITVKGLDAIDGTPVLDIKPYAPVYDGVNDPLIPAWFLRLMQM